MNLEQSYQHITDPNNFVHNFSNLGQFRDWCDLGNINDLKDTLKAFEAAGLFEHCTVIQATIDIKVDELLDGLI